MDVEIVQVTDLEEDWPELAGLFKELHEYHLRLTGAALLRDWEERTRARVEAMLRSGEALVLTARQSGAAVGFVSAQIFENPTIVEERVGFIDSIYLKPEVRGRGVFSKLLGSVEGWFKARGISAAQLNVASANKHAREIWEAKGYEPYMERLRKRLD